MFVRMVTTLAVAALAAGASGCASSPEQAAENHRAREYRTGSNIAIHDGDMARGEKTVKPDVVPIFKGPGPMVGPTGAGGG